MVDIIQGGDAKKLVAFAEASGQSLAQQLTSSQIRNVFGQVRQIQAIWRIDSQQGRARRQLLLLKPRLAYQAKKERGHGVEELRDILTPAIDAVFDGSDGELNGRFERFVDLFEAILAYHKAYSQGRG
ncbi:MAG: type III-A CRISPR-associated protein Csm2 [Chloroflexi bacterium]|nr:type III-A CRISPR-associated protein Csm2 [Chloroflexota bacterium]